MNEDIKKMANLLRTGHTMLNQACPICNNPIFRNSDGLTFCPVCNREVIMYENASQKGSIKKEQDTKHENNLKIEEERDTQKNILLEESIEIIIQKINFMNQKLKSEMQIDLIEKYSRLLLRLYKLLNKIKNFR